MRGFQLWVNLPAVNKMKAAHYDDVAGEKIPQTTFAFGSVKALAGKTEIAGQPIRGYFEVPDTEVLYLDICLGAKQSLAIPVPDDHNALVYFYEGKGSLGSESTPSPAQTLSRLSGSGEIFLSNAENSEARLLVLAGKPLKEPIVQHGPFVMNTREEIDQAITDYQNGRLTA